MALFTLCEHSRVITIWDPLPLPVYRDVYIQSTNEELFSSKKEFDKTKAQFAALIVDDKAFAKVDGATFEPPAAASASTAFQNQKQ